MGKQANQTKFGAELRKRREAKGISLRQLAKEVGVKPPYLSRVENGEVPASEELVLSAAKILGENPEVLYSFAGKVTSRLAAAIAKHPKAFADIIFNLENAPEHAILRVIREVRDGEW